MEVVKCLSHTKWNCKCHISFVSTYRRGPDRLKRTRTHCRLNRRFVPHVTCSWLCREIFITLREGLLRDALIANKGNVVKFFRDSI